jgi:hypothetical protein
LQTAPDRTLQDSQLFPRTSTNYTSLGTLSQPVDPINLSAIEQSRHLEVLETQSALEKSDKLSLRSLGWNTFGNPWAHCITKHVLNYPFLGFTIFSSGNMGFVFVAVAPAIVLHTWWMLNKCLKGRAKGWMFWMCSKTSISQVTLILAGRFCRDYF